MLIFWPVQSTTILSLLKSLKPATTRLSGFADERRPGLSGRVHRGLDEAFAILRRAVADSHPAGAAAAVVDRNGVLARAWGGRAKLPPDGIEISPNTIFDLASLTKVMITLPLALRWSQERRWSLRAPVARWVPGYPIGGITLWHCLTHSSGLPAHRPFHLTAHGPTAVRRALFAIEPQSPPGAAVIYSDLNFMLLGWAVARCGGATLDRLARRFVCAPLGLEHARYRPPLNWKRRIAATENSGNQRKRRGLIWGSVHDGNAHALGGVSGHAGLFAPLDDVVRFVRPPLVPRRHPLLTPASMEAMARRQAGTPPDVPGLGWQLQPFQMLRGWPPETYGHTGFTGTSLLVAPSAGLAVVLLSNAVHPRRHPDGILALRAAFHGALAKGLIG